MSHKWYIAQAYSGYEKKVAASIMEKVKLKDLDESFEKIVVPTEEVVEVKQGKKRTAERNSGNQVQYTCSLEKCLMTTDQTGVKHCDKIIKE